MAPTTMKALITGIVVVLFSLAVSCKPKPPAAELTEEPPVAGPRAMGTPVAKAQPAKPAPEDTSAHNYLAERLQDSDKFVRYKAAFDAKKLKPEEATKPIIAALTKLYTDPEEQSGTREVAGRALARCDPVAALAAWRVDKVQSWDVLIEVGPAAIGELRAVLLGSKSGEFELMAFIALTEILGQHPAHLESRGAIPLLLQALDQEYDARLRPLATRALSAFGKSLNKELAGHLRGPRPKLRRQAALAAGLLDEPSAQLLEALDQAARDKDPAVRKEALRARKKHGAQSKPAGQRMP